MKLVTECTLTFSTLTANVNEMEGRERLDLPKVCVSLLLLKTLGTGKISIV